MSWLGNGFREEAKSLADAYAQMYAPQEEKQEEEKEEEVLTEGKKDACYNKVKSRYSVWPSAYASGALVKCRAKGAKNWGNSSKKEAFDLAIGEMIQEGIDLSDINEEDAWDAFLFGWEELSEERYKKQRNINAYPARMRQALLNSSSKDRDAAFEKYDRENPREKKEENELLSAMADAYEMMYEKKTDSDKCGDDTYWDKEEKKCKSKKSKRRSTVIVGGGRWGHSHDHDDDGENDTDSGAAGDAAGAGDGGGGE